MVLINLLFRAPPISVVRLKSIYIKALKKCICYHSRGSNRESTVFKNKEFRSPPEFIPYSIRGGNEAKKSSNICKEALDTVHCPASMWPQNQDPSNLPKGFCHKLFGISAYSFFSLSGCFFSSSSGE